MAKFKVIGISNFNLESVSDILLMEGLSDTEAKKEAAYQNSKVHDFSTYYYKIVSDDYELWDSSKLY